MEDKSKPIKVNASMQTVYRAKFADGKLITPGSIVFAGISIRTQPNLKGQPLEAFAKLFNHIETEHKYVYVADGLRKYNLAAASIVSLINNGIAITESNESIIDPILQEESAKDEGKDWVEQHSHQFCLEDGTKAPIIRHSLVSPKLISAALKEELEWYLDIKNQHFRTKIDAGVRDYMARNKINLPEGSEKLFTAAPLKDDLLSRCVLDFIKREKISPDTDLMLLDNPIYRALLKLSFFYVFEESCGFRIAFEDVRKTFAKTSNANPEFVLIYPGELAFVQAYFNLVTKHYPHLNLVMKAKAIHYDKSKTKPAESKNQSTQHTHSSTSTSSDEDDTESSVSPTDEEREKERLEKAIFVCGKSMNNPNYSFRDYQRDLGEKRTNPLSFFVDRKVRLINQSALSKAPNAETETLEL
ncbi:MAG: hypothetical protein M3R00_03720 [Pseudomonadota bacterium]|nr:hypothetical protein [Pseudomonadota bacterium]